MIVQRNRLAQFTTTSVVVPLTTNLRRAIIPGTIVIPSGAGGLTQESVVLSYQIVVINRQRLIRKLGTLSPNYLLQLFSGK
ncbi:type II toxin-antitoxin system PemK/MazF family toxin [Nostoc sp.]|uniref:type II toxin-antitoxin system PemK/MazF family toxin n=1 Tax=Nostoc sp. TaxID=1180 RepID=UPI002FF7A227